MTGILNVLAGMSGGGWAFTMVAGTNGSVNGFHLSQYGTINGSSSSATLPNGHTLLQLSSTSAGQIFLIISGLSSDPGQSSLTALTINGQVLTGSAAAYSFGTSQAQWVWSGSVFNNGGTYPGSISGAIVR